MKSPSSKLRIVVLGYIVRGPLGGLVWHHLQYLIGLQKMGHEVFFLEDSDDYPSCYRPGLFELTTDASYGLKFISDISGQYIPGIKWAYYDAHRLQWHGSTREETVSFCRSADILLNLSGSNPLREWVLKIPQRVFIDTDPVFTQIRHLTDAGAATLANQHNCFFSFGENFGRQNCSMPDDNLKWKHTRQPVVSEIWQASPGNPKAKWTTVMQWDSYQKREYNGKIYGMKSSSFDPFFELPLLINESFEIAMGGATAPKDKISSRGWIIKDPLAVTKTPETYKDYIRSSKGEWSVAKQGYVAAGSGWFSERSCCYLASGRPVVIQDTGFSAFLETGRGLLCFTNTKEAVAAINEINSNYPVHCNSARDIAEEYFGYRKVLNNLIEKTFTAAL